MKLIQHLDKNNLHHAYLIEGKREEILSELFEFLESLGVKSTGNPDVSHIILDTFVIEDARNLKSFSTERGFSTTKKIFIISTNNFLLEAQNSLLKMFEEPIENTHFFVIVPDANALLKTFVSRFYVISPRQNLSAELKDAEKFLSMPLQKRIDFVKELTTSIEEEDEEGNEIAVLDSTRSKSIKFLNALEFALHNKFSNSFSGLLQPSAGTFPIQNSFKICFNQIFKVREFLRMPGSSTKTLMESVALVTPNF